VDFTKGKFKPKSASSILPIFRLQFACFCVSNFQELFVFRLVQTSSPGFFQTGSGSAKRTGF